MRENNSERILVDREIIHSKEWNKDKFSKGKIPVDLMGLADNGQISTSITKLSIRWKWNRKAASRFLTELEREGIIKVSKNTRGILISISDEYL